MDRSKEKEIMQHAIHHSQKFGNTHLYLFDGYQDYFEYLKENYGLSYQEPDENGNYIEKEINYEEWNNSLTQPHFSDEDPKIINLHWEASNGRSEDEMYSQMDMGQLIMCIMTRHPNTITMADIIGSIGHEYSHAITLPDYLKESTAAYDTEEGYEQEERKAMWFEDYTNAVYRITRMYLEMFGKMGIKRRKQKSK